MNAHQLRRAGFEVPSDTEALGLTESTSESTFPRYKATRTVTVAEYGTFFALKNGSDTLATSPIREPLDELAKRYNAYSGLVERLQWDESRLNALDNVPRVSLSANDFRNALYPKN